MDSMIHWCLDGSLTAPNSLSSSHAVETPLDVIGRSVMRVGVAA